MIAKVLFLFLITFTTHSFTKRTALVETTWISELNDDKLKNYDEQIDDYLSKHLNIRNCKINFKETGAIPLFRQKNVNKKNREKRCSSSCKTYKFKSKDRKSVV